MEATLTPIFSLVQSTTGRRILALRQVRKPAVALNFTGLVDHVDQALAHERQTREYETLWAGTSRHGAYSPRLVGLDHLIDPVITSVRDIAKAQVRSAPAGDPIVAMVDDFLFQLFPAGVGAITSLPYVEEIAAVEGIVAKLQGPLANQVTLLGLTRPVDRLIELAAAYRREIEDVKPIEFRTVREARARGQHYLLEIVAMIAGTYFRLDDPDHVAARVTLLEPILAQDRAIRAQYRARRAVRDIDPDTGEEIGEDTGEDTGDEVDLDTGEDTGDEVSEDTPGDASDQAPDNVEDEPASDAA